MSIELKKQQELFLRIEKIEKIAQEEIRKLTTELDLRNREINELKGQINAKLHSAHRAINRLQQQLIGDRTQWEWTIKQEKEKIEFRHKELIQRETFYNVWIDRMEKKVNQSNLTDTERKEISKLLRELKSKIHAELQIEKETVKKMWAGLLEREERERIIWDEEIEQNQVDKDLVTKDLSRLEEMILSLEKQIK